MVNRIYILEIFFVKSEERQFEYFPFQTEEEIPFNLDYFYGLSSFSEDRLNFLKKICDIDSYKVRAGFFLKFSEKTLLTF